jgi:hypothetical protein
MGLFMTPPAGARKHNGVLLITGTRRNWRKIQFETDEEGTTVREAEVREDDLSEPGSPASDEQA